MDTTKFNKVTPDNFSRLKTYLQQNGCSGLDGNEGRAVANCLKLGYKYDPEAGILALEAEALPENLQALPDHIRVAAGHRLLANVMGLNRPGTMIVPTFTSNPPYPYRPSLYGVYNYVDPYVMNWSCHPFTFKSQSLTNGTLSYYLPVIPYNLNEAFRLFSAQSVKLSGTGVGGSVDYIWRDNAHHHDDKFLPQHRIYIHLHDRLQHKHAGLQRGEYRRGLGRVHLSRPYILHLEGTLQCELVRGSCEPLQPVPAASHSACVWRTPSFCAMPTA
jgi:hypothetical protein